MITVIRQGLKLRKEYVQDPNLSEAASYIYRCEITILFGGKDQTWSKELEVGDPLAVEVKTSAVYKREG